jgi:hypothetical protein
MEPLKNKVVYLKIVFVVVYYDHFS